MLTDVFKFWFSCLSIIPALVLALYPFLPMITREEIRRLHGCYVFLLVFWNLILAMIYAKWFVGETVNMFSLPLILPYLICFIRSFKFAVAPKLFIFFNAMGIVTIPCAIMYGVEGYMYPHHDPNMLIWSTLWIQIIVGVVLMLILSYPAKRLFPETIKNLTDPFFWRFMFFIEVFLNAYAFFIVPLDYSVLYKSNLFLLFFAAEVALLLFMFFIDFLMMKISAFFVKSHQLERELRFMTIQSHQYQQMLDSAQQSRRLRHDFRHLVHSMKDLITKRDWEKLDEIMSDYIADVDKNSMEKLCDNTAVNSLLLYFKGMAESEGIKCDWRIVLPNPLPVVELDFLTLIGNLIENAIHGAMEAPEGKKYSSISVEAQDGNIYIVSSNSYSGRLNITDEGIRSTKHGGTGLGLYSIETIVNKYNGMLNIDHDDQEFRTDILLKTDYE